MEVTLPAMPARTGYALKEIARRPHDFALAGVAALVNLDNSDTYLELAGDYYFTEQFSAGISLEFAGDTDSFTIGARWFFK